MKEKHSPAKSIKKSYKKSAKDTTTLEQIYRQYLVPMPLETWSRTINLSQPSILKQVPTKTAYSYIGAIDA